MATYIPCTTGTVALYQEDVERLVAVVVEAWDDQGAACVAGQFGLVAATALRAGFLRLEQASAVIPSPSRPAREPHRPERPPRPTPAPGPEREPSPGRDHR